MLALVQFGALLLLFWAFGERLLRWAKLEGGSAAERFGLSVAAGFAVVSPIVFVLALAGAWSVPAAAILTAILFLVALRPFREPLRRLAPAPVWAALRPRASMEWIAGALTVCLLGFGLIFALAPPTGIDVVRTHFTVPKVILQNGGLVVRDDGILGDVGSVHALYLFAMTLGGELLAKLFAFGASLVATVLAASLSERLRPQAGPWGALLVASSPFSLGYTGTAFLDLPLLMYVLAAALALARYESGNSGTWALPACFFAGTAIGVKTAAFPAAIVFAAVAFRFVKGARRGAGAALLGVALFAIPAGLYWIWDGLPGEVRLSATDPAAPPKGVLEGAMGVVLAQLVPIQYLWDSAGACVLIGIAGWLLTRRPEEACSLPWLLGLSFLAYLAILLLFRPPALWVLHHGRYFGPFLIGFGAPLAAAFFAWGRSRGGTLRWVLTLMILLPVVPLGLLKAGRAAVAAPAAAGLESRSDYLSKKIETFAACAWLNEQTDQNVRVLAMIHRPYFLDVPFYHAGDGADDPVIRRADSPASFATQLSEQGFTHVLYEPTVSRPAWMSDAEQALARPPFREVRRWRWGHDRWVILSEIVRE